MSNKPKIQTYLTEVGVAVYPRVNVPDFKYKKENGEYSTKLRLSANESARLIKLIQDETEADYKKQCAALGKTKIKRSPNIPFKAEEDDQGEANGNVLFSFKLAGQFKSRETGEIIKLAPQIYDRFGKVVTEEVWGGSKLRVCFTLKPYYTEGLGHGMTLKLKAIQVHELVTKGSGMSAESFGFNVEQAPMGEDTDEVLEAPSTEGAANATKGDF